MQKSFYSKKLFIFNFSTLNLWNVDVELRTKKLRHFPPLFSLFSSFQFTWKAINKIAYDWMRTADLWSQKRLLYRLRHNHCPLRHRELWLHGRKKKCTSVVQTSWHRGDHIRDSFSNHLSVSNLFRTRPFVGSEICLGPPFTPVPD